MGEARPQPTHRVGRPNDQGIPQVFGEPHSVLHGCRDVAAGNLCSSFDHQILEDLTILTTLDCLKRRANEFHAVFLQNALGVQCHGGIQRGLATQRWQNSVGFLLRDDRL